MTTDEFKLLLEEKTSVSEVDIDNNSTPETLIIKSNSILEVCDFLKNHDKCYFDSLSCITGLDNGVEAGTMEVIYNLYSIPFNHHLMLRVLINRNKPEIDSVESVWKTADWLERETYDLLGINFKGHPDLRRILLPNDWEGHPLRKDYELQERYHGIKVDY